MPTDDFWRSKIYLDEENYDKAIFGAVSQTEEGAYHFSVSVWDSVQDGILIQREASVESIFDVFSLMDEITIEVAEAFTGQRIGFGHLEFSNTGTEGIYNVYIDEQYLGQNIDEQKVLFGRRDIRITVPAGIGEKEVLRKDIVLEEGEEAGRSPLELIGLYEGRYSLRAAASGYLPIDTLVEIMPNRTNSYNFQLTLDTESEEVKGLIENKADPTLVFWLSFAVQGGLVISNLIMEGPPDGIPLTYMLITGTNFATFSAGGSREGMVINGATLLLTMAPVLYIDYMGPSAIGPLLNAFLPAAIFLSGKITDSIVSQKIERVQRERDIDRIKEIGIEEFRQEKEAALAGVPKTRWVIQADSEMYLGAGLSLPSGSRKFLLEGMGGIGVTAGEDGETDLSYMLAGKGLFIPFRTDPFSIYTGIKIRYSFSSSVPLNFSPAVVAGYEYTSLVNGRIVPFAEILVGYSIVRETVYPAFSPGLRF